MTKGNKPRGYLGLDGKKRKRDAELTTIEPARIADMARFMVVFGRKGLKEVALITPNREPVETLKRAKELLGDFIFTTSRTLNFVEDSWVDNHQESFETELDAAWLQQTLRAYVKAARNQKQYGMNPRAVTKERSR